MKMTPKTRQIPPNYPLPYVRLQGVKIKRVFKKKPGSLTCRELLVESRRTKSRVLQIESCFSRAGAAAVVSKVITVYRVLRSTAVRLQEQGEQCNCRGSSSAAVCAGTLRQRTCLHKSYPLVRPPISRFKEPSFCSSPEVGDPSAPLSTKFKKPVLGLSPLSTIQGGLAKVAYVIFLMGDFALIHITLETMFKILKIPTNFSQNESNRKH